VLRDGAVTARGSAGDISLQWIVRHMVGENFDLGSPPTRHSLVDIALSIEDVSVPDPAATGDFLVDHLSLHVRAGEIVCIYGLMGAGRTELLECVAGRMPMAGGRIRLGDEDVSRLSVADRIARGLVLVPEDRQRDGLVQTMSVGQNLSLASIGAFVRNLLLSGARERTMVGEAIRDVRVKTVGAQAPIGSLSGGNQQKVVIGKMLMTEPKVVLLDEPSRGIDVGAKAEVFRLLGEQAARGLAVLFSTSEVGECLSIAHRVAVMRRGRISAEFAAGVSKEQIMAASGEAAPAELIGVAELRS
jgi:erythritol transport system ATP-binding protein